MSFALSFYGLGGSVKSPDMLPLLIGPPGPAAGDVPGGISNSLLSDMPTATFKGRISSGNGPPQDLTAAQATSLLNTATSSLKGLMSSADFTKLGSIASGATANAGTVTSVAITVPTGLSVTGSPVTSSGTLAIGLQAGYGIPTTARQADWDTAFSQVGNKANASAVGISASATNMGTFTGGIIPANQTAKQALQSLSDGVSLRVLASSLAAAGGAATVGTQDASNAQADLNTRVVRVSTRTTMKALNVMRFGVASLQEAGREGTFSLKTGTAPTDALEGVYVVSDTAGYYWEREWDGIIAKAEWFGAVLNDSGVDSYAALQACLDVTGKLFLPTGSYYSSAGLLLPDNAVVWGQGALFSGITFSTATGHLMRQQGVSGTSYKAGANLADFALGRTPNPTTPGSVSGDISQGHGLSFFMVSNPRVRSVYTYNNLVELYVNNVLSPDIHDVRGIRQTGSGSDRWYGCYVDGVTTGGTFGGPSPNPSTTITKPNMVSNASVGTCYHYYLNGALQDLWMIDPEAAGQGGTSSQFFLNINGATAGDVHIVRPIADGYKTNGIYVKGAPVGSSINIVDAWVAPSASATSTGIVIDASHGVNLSGRADFASATGLACITANDCTELDCNFRSSNSQTPFSATSMSSSTVLVKAFKNIAGGGGSFGNIITLIGGSQNKLAAYGTVSPSASPQLWLAGIALNDSAANCQLDVSGVPSSSVVNRLTISGTGVTTQGAVGTHFVINPGASGFGFDGTNVWRASPGGAELGQVSSTSLSYSSNGGQVLFGLSGGNNYIDGTTYLRGTVNGSTVAQFAPSIINFYQPLALSSSLSVSGTFTAGNDINFGKNDTINTIVNIGAGATGNKFALTDYIGDTTYTDFGLRVGRANDGANGTSVIQHRGTGSLTIGAVDGGNLSFFTNSITRFRINEDGSALYSGGLFNVSWASGAGAVANFENTSTGSALQGVVAKIQSGGNNTSSFHFAGVTNGVNLWYLYGNGTTSYSSDERLKNRFEPARTGYLDDWKRLEFKRWNYANDDDGTPKNLGPTAQGVRKVFPSLALEAMHEIEIDGTKIKPLQVLGSVLYGEVMGKALQELAFMVDDLADKLKSQSEKLALIEAALSNDS